MTDWDVEFKLLQEYLDYRIEISASYHQHHSPKAIMKTFRELGIMFIQYGYHTLSFESWKRAQKPAGLIITLVLKPFITKNLETVTIKK